MAALISSPVPDLGSAASALKTLAITADGIDALRKRFDDLIFSNAFNILVDRIMAVRGRVIVTGMGKSGIIARKITATLTSTGTPAGFLHPAEAGHGDLGMITEHDLVLMLTVSGDTAELGPILAYCKRFGVPVAAMTSRQPSIVALAADICLLLPAVAEACPNDLTPTTSTTLQVVLGDALAVALIERRRFSAADFFTFHPNGRLGARLLKVGDLMATGEHAPQVRIGASLLDATIEMTRARFGGTAVVDAAGKLLGAFTDGDLRRTVQKGGGMHAPVQDWMNHTPLTIGSGELASEALHIMQVRSVTMLFVMDDGDLAGVIHMHEILRAGVA